MPSPCTIKIVKSILRFFHLDTTKSSLETLMSSSLSDISKQKQMLKDQELVLSARLITCIGDGTTGRVYKAIANCGTIIAVKIVPFCYSAYLKNMNRSKFNKMESEAMNEAKIHCKLHHNCITELYCFYTSQNCIVLHMEYFDGQSLWPFLRSNNYTLDETAAKKIVVQLSKAIEFLHAKNIVHLDLHMGNVLVNDNYDVKVIDFGCATTAENSEYKRRDVMELKAIQDMILLSTKDPGKVKMWYLKQWL